MKQKNTYTHKKNIKYMKLRILHKSREIYSFNLLSVAGSEFQKLVTCSTKNTCRRPTLLEHLWFA